MRVRFPPSGWVFAFVLGVPLSSLVGGTFGCLIAPLGVGLLATGAQFFIDLNQGTLMLDIFTASFGLGWIVGAVISVIILALWVSKSVQPYRSHISRQTITNWTISGFLLWAIGLPLGLILALAGLLVGAWLIVFLGMLSSTLSFLGGGIMAGVPLRLLAPSKQGEEAE
jgi:uncharacterized protein YacL